MARPEMARPQREDNRSGPDSSALDASADVKNDTTGRPASAALLPDPAVRADASRVQAGPGQSDPAEKRTSPAIDAAIAAWVRTGKLGEAILSTDPSRSCTGST